MNLKDTLKENLEGYRKIAPELVGREDYIADKIEKVVKEAVLEFENYLSDRQDYISKNPNTQPRNNFDLILLIESINQKHKEIFGNFQDDTISETGGKK